MTDPSLTALAASHFAAKLLFETDVSDVHDDLHSGRENFVLVDSRGQDAWDQGHIPGAIHLPTPRIATDAEYTIPRDAHVVTYCWGPGCNGATRAALEFARLGYHVQEMIGGYEYWVREGFAVESAAGTVVRPADPLATVEGALSCAC